MANDLLNIPKPNVSQNPLGCVELVSGLPQKVNLNKTGVNVILPSTVCWESANESISIIISRFSYFVPLWESTLTDFFLFLIFLVHLFKKGIF